MGMKYPLKIFHHNIKDKPMPKTTYLANTLALATAALVSTGIAAEPTSQKAERYAHRKRKKPRTKRSMKKRERTRRIRLNRKTGKRK